MAKQKKPSYEDLGKMLNNIYETGYIDRNQSYKHSFVKGLVGGFGGVIGATIVVALLLWILSAFKQVPFVGPIINSIKQTVQTKQ